MKELFAVVDTNVFISALIGGSTSAKLYEAFVEGKFVPVLSHSMLEELFETLSSPLFEKYFTKEDIIKLEHLLSLDAVLINTRKKLRDCRDPKDNIILECALEAGADCIVTGDNDLLVLNPYHGIRILTPGKFLKFLI